MNKQFQWILCAGLALNSSPAQLNAEDILVQTRLMSDQYFDQTGETRIFDLRDFFQYFAEPGPKVTVKMTTPVFDEMRDLFYSFQTDDFGNWLYEGSGDTKRLLTENDENFVANVPTYKTVEGVPYETPYSNLFLAYPQDFQYEDTTFEIQLYPEDAPITVANFLTYVNSDDAPHDGTVVHRLERKATSGIDVLQAGGYTLKEFPEQDFFAAVRLDDIGTIPFEAGRTHAKGTIGVARGTTANSGGREWFINVTDNLGFNNAYSSFAEIIDYEEQHEDFFANLLRTTVYNYMYSESGASYFTTYPRFSWFPDDPRSHVIFETFDPLPGSTAGLIFDCEIVEPGDEDEDEEPDDPHYPESFNITLVDGTLSISAVDTGYTTIKVTGGDGSEDEDKNINFDVFLYSADPEIISKMVVSEVRNNREYVSSWFGTFRDTYYFPAMEHLNHGSLKMIGLNPDYPLEVFYVAPEEAGGEPILLTGQHLLYHDNTLGWIFIPRSRFPWVYSVQYGWLYYVKGTGRYEWATEDSPSETKEGRWFYDPTKSEAEKKGWITDFELLTGTE